MKLTYIFIIVMVSISICSLSSAYNTEDTKKSGYIGGHEQITDWAYKLTQKDNISLGSIDYAALRTATKEEDSGFSPLHHFYNPLTGSALLGTPNKSIFGTAKFHAHKWYDSAKMKFIEKSGNAWSDLGHAMHLLQDMAAPSHANSASHFLQSKSGAGYEWWVTKNWFSDATKPANAFNIEQYLNFLYTNYYEFRPIAFGDMNGSIDSMAMFTQAGGYPYDYDFTYVRTLTPAESQDSRM